MKRIIFISLALALLGACSSGPKRVVLDSSSSDKPDWADSNKVSWKDDGKYFFRGNYTVRGNERSNACIDLAKLNVKESLITEIQDELKGAIDSAQDSIREDAEILLTKSRSSRYQGAISGLRFVESYWEKYAMANKEQKIACYVLGQIKEVDYTKTKRNVVDKITRANPKLKEAVIKKQIKFFEE